METKEKEIKKLSSKNSFWKTTIFYYKKYWKLALMIILFVAISSMITVLMPKVINIILVNLGSTTGGSQEIVNLCLVVFGMIVLLGVSYYARRLFANRLSRRIEIDYRNKILSHLLDLDMKFYEKHASGELTTKIINDTSIISENANEIPILLLSSVITLIGATVIMVLIDWKMTLTILSIVMFILLLSSFTFNILRKSNRNLKKVYTKVNSGVLDRLGVIRLIKSNATQNYEKENFKKLHEDYDKAGKKNDQREGFVLGTFMALISSVNVIAVIIGIIFINFGLIDKNNLQSTFIPFILSVNTLIFPIFQTISLLGRLAQATVSIERLENILSTKSEIQEIEKPIVIDEIKDNIIFENVSFAYKEGKYVVKNFDFVFEKNKSYALVGKTGSGKTTISRLLLRFYDPQEGEIKINGFNLKDLNLESYLSRIGYIEQEPEIFNGTLLENISYGSFNSTLDEIIEASKKANLDDFIQTLENKYDTNVGEKGFILSGGQKQRVSIARMILKNPDLLFLDEATSALDNIVEKQIQKQLDQLMIGRTTIIIAHRLSTIQNVDQILVLDENKGVVQVGTFKELINIPGHFQDLYNAGLMNK